MTLKGPNPQGQTPLPARAGHGLVMALPGQEGGKMKGPKLLGRQYSQAPAISRLQSTSPTCVDGWAHLTKWRPPRYKAWHGPDTNAMGNGSAICLPEE